MNARTRFSVFVARTNSTRCDCGRLSISSGLRAAEPASDGLDRRAPLDIVLLKEPTCPGEG